MIIFHVQQQQQYKSKMQSPLNSTPKLVQQFTGPLKSFYEFHGVQFIKCGFPPHLIQPLFQKLLANTYDVGDSFKIIDNQDNELFHVEALKALQKQQHIWVLDHLLTFRYTQLRKKLEDNPDVVQRLLQITKYLDKKMELVGSVTMASTVVDPLSIDLDSQSLESLSSISIPSNTVCLSLVDNKLNSTSQIIELLKTLPDLKVLWIYDNPISGDPLLNDYVIGRKSIELYNSKLTHNSTEWILKYLLTKNVLHTTKLQNQSVTVLDLSDRQIFTIVDISLFSQFPNLRVLNIKGTKITCQTQIPKLLQLLQLSSLRQIKCDRQLQLQIFSLYRESPSQISSSLLVNDHNIFKPIPTVLQTTIDLLQQRMFKLSSCYRLADDNRYDETSVWYINDELGCALTHSDTPQCKIAPFLYAPNKRMDGEVRACTLMWLCRGVKEGEIVERDYLNGIGEDKQRSSRLVVWYETPREMYVELYKSYNKTLDKIASDFKNSQKQVEEAKFVPTIKQKYKVVTDYIFLKQFLTLPEFQFVEDAEEADIIWANANTKDSEAVSHLVYQKGTLLTNQFKHELCLITKNALAHTIQSTLGNTPFLQRTYDLSSELPIFLGHFFQNQRDGVDNLWISKPPNMARSMDMIVTNNLQTIVKNMETGPKLVQKYITNPVKRLNRKIDLRFIVAVKSITPLNIYLYRHFWIRTSNNEYNIDCRYRQEYETHFTVMNYGQTLTRVDYPDFIKQFDEDYCPVEWAAVYEKVREMLRQTFVAVKRKYPEMHDSRSRAYYGVDVMVEEGSMEPKLLEFTFSPDCERACKYYPSFYNDLFEVLFLERENENVLPLFEKGG